MRNHMTEPIIDKVIWGLTTLLFSSFCIYNTSIFGNYILFGITVIVALLLAVKNKGHFPVVIDKFQGKVATFGAFCIISSIWSLSANDAIVKGVTVFEILLCLSVFYSYYSNTFNAVDRLLKSIIWGGYIICIYTFIYTGIDVIFSTLISGGRLDSSFDNINTIGALMAICAVLTVYYTAYEGIKLSNLLIVPVIALVAASGSRKALLILVSGIILVFFLRQFSTGKKSGSLRFLLFLALLFVLVYILAETGIFSGISTRMDGLLALITGEGSIEHSAWLRQQYAILGITIFLQHPILGIGIGNAHIINSQNYGLDTYLHNNYAELLASGGLVGFCVFYSIYVFFAVNLLKNRRIKNKETQILLILIFALLFSDMGLVSYYSKRTYFYFMIIFLYIKQCNRDNE